MSNAIVERYRTPSIERTAEITVGLDDFDDAVIVEYLRHRGFEVNGEKGHAPTAVVVMHEPIDKDGNMVIDPSDLQRIKLLAMCGQRNEAIDLLLSLIREAIQGILL